MYNDFYHLYRSYGPMPYDYIDPMNMLYRPQWVFEYAEQVLEEEHTPEDSLLRQRNEVEEILNIFLTRRQDVLRQIEAYGVPRPISILTTRRIIQFTLNNARPTGNLQQETERLFRRFIDQDRAVVSALRVLRVPENVIHQYIRQVIRITLRNMEAEPEPNINATVRRILREFEEQHPNFLGLTTRYNIPISIARNITRDIIEFTVRNLDRIPQVGSLQSRADAMLRLLDRERPELIEQMIRRGVPAGQAEAITRQIILFTLRNVPLPRE